MFTDKGSLLTIKNSCLIANKTVANQAILEPTTIGVFDSGIGGLTVVKAIHNYLPDQKLLYIGDNANSPWGDKSKTQIITYADKLVKFLIKNNCKIIVFACHTASCVALPYIQQQFSQNHFIPKSTQIKLFGITDPTISLLSEVNFRNFKEIGIIGTKQTIDSMIYEKKIQKLQTRLKIDLKDKIVVKSLATPLLAPLIEENWLNSKAADLIIAKYLNKLNLKNNSILILACTHYPLIKKNIEYYYRKMHKKITIIDPSYLIAKEIKQILHQGYLNKEAVVKFKQNYKQSFNITVNNKNNNYFYYTERSKPFLRVAKVFFPTVKFQFLPLWD